MNLNIEHESGGQNRQQDSQDLHFLSPSTVVSGKICNVRLGIVCESRGESPLHGNPTPECLSRERVKDCAYGPSLDAGGLSRSSTIIRTINNFNWTPSPTTPTVAA